MNNNGYTPLDELTHAKYTSKKMVNGKWRYTYAKDTKDKTTKSNNLASKYGKASNWKYLKREKVNGKWQYTYASNATTNANKKSDDVADIAIGKTAVDKTAVDKTAVDAARARVYIAKKLYDDARDTASRDYHITKEERANVEAAERLYNKRLDQYKKVGEEYVKSLFGESEAELPPLYDEVDQSIEDSRQKNWDIAERATEKHDDEVRAREESKLKDRAEAKAELLNPLPSLPFKETAFSHDEDMAAVNPNYNIWTDGWSKNLYDQNCAVCTITYDLRRRGYDVTAESELATVNDGTGTTGMVMSDILGCYSKPNGDRLSFENDAVKLSDTVEKYNVDGKTSSMECMKKAMLSEGEGARGNLVLHWKQDGGHSVSWEVENGEVIIRDCQTNMTCKLEEYEERVKDTCWYLRTDNLVPTDNCLQYVKNRKG